MKGLSEGLQQSGVAECCWAVEKNEIPATAFQMNNKQATVYIEDCVSLLRRIKKANRKVTSIFSWKLVP